MTELKPCPFCGGEPIIVRHEFCGTNDTFGVECVDCKTKGYQFYDDIGHAIEAWNTRTSKGGTVR